MQTSWKMETGHPILEVWKSDLADYFSWPLKKDIVKLQANWLQLGSSLE